MRPGYLVHSALSGMARAWALTAMSLSTLAVGLWLLGLLAMVALSCRQLAAAWTDQGHLTCGIDANVAIDEREALRAHIATLDGVEQVTLLTPEDNLRALQSLGPSLSEGVSAEWLPASLRIVPTKAIVRADELQQLAQRIGVVPGVFDIDFGAAPLLHVHRVVDGIAVVACGCGLALVLALTFMVNNTIRLMLFSRQDELRILKLIGATDAFVQAPFVMEGLVWGVGAGVVAAVGGALFERAIFAHLAQWSAALQMPIPRLVSPQLTCVQLIVGGVIGVIGSTLASRAFLRGEPGGAP